MKSLIKRCLIQTLGYQRFLVGTYWMRRLQQILRGQRSEFAVLASLTEPGTLILDVGANIGYVSAVLATVPGAQVYSFEPDADNFACLVYTIGRRPNVVVQRIAIGAEDGEALLQEVFDHGVKQHALTRVQSASGSRSSSPRVLVRSIDSLRTSMNGRIGLIKLDVERSECNVLRGMITSVRASRPLIHAEICGSVAIDTFNRFCSADSYAPYKWRSRRFQPVNEIAGGGNFLLVPRERQAFMGQTIQRYKGLGEMHPDQVESRRDSSRRSRWQCRTRRLTTTVVRPHLRPPHLSTYGRAFKSATRFA